MNTKTWKVKAQQRETITITIVLKNTSSLGIKPFSLWSVLWTRMTGVTQHLCINTGAASVMLLGSYAPHVEEVFLVSVLDRRTVECDSACYKYEWPFCPASRISSSSFYSTGLRELICPTVTCILQTQTHKLTHTHPTNTDTQTHTHTHTHMHPLAESHTTADTHIHFGDDMKPGGLQGSEPCSPCVWVSVMSIYIQGVQHTL